MPIIAYGQMFLLDTNLRVNALRSDFYYAKNSNSLSNQFVFEFSRNNNISFEFREKEVERA